MSVLFCCDHCPRRRLGSFDVDAGRWNPPPGWFSFELSDWQAHACSAACLDGIKTEQTNDPTPTTGAAGFALPGGRAP